MKTKAESENMKKLCFISIAAFIMLSCMASSPQQIATGKDYKTIVSGKWEVYRNGEFVKDKNGKPITYKNTDQPGTVGFDYKF